MTLIRHLAALRPGPLTSTTASAETSLRAIARRWLALDEGIRGHDAHLEQLTRRCAPELVRAHGMGRARRPRCCCSWATTRGGSARRRPWPSSAAPARSPPPAARPAGTGSTAAATARPTPPSIVWSSCACVATRRPRLRQATYGRGQEQAGDHPLPQALRGTRDLRLSLPRPRDGRSSANHGLTSIGASTRPWRASSAASRTSSSTAPASRPERRRRRAIFEYIEAFYSRQRRHSALGFLTPAQAYEQMAKAA